MRRDIAGHGQAGRLRPADQVQRLPGGEMRQVEPGARLVADHIGEHCEVAPHCGRLGAGRPAAQAQDGRDEPVVRLRAIGLRGILGVIDDG